MRTVVGILCFICVAALDLKIGGTTSDSNFTTQLEAPAALRRISGSTPDRGGNYERPSSCDSEQCFGCQTNNYYVVQRRDHIGYAVCGDDCKEKADCPDWDNSQFCSPLDVCFLVCFEEWDCPPGRYCVRIETDMFDVRLCMFDMTERRLL
ncbi:hypothetical protein FOZ61_009274 [Perkinsus olseni]|uniref:Uncharacterized protein n=1 Tax=Perkinsus olseni TaxID=32597 RepID=A0A7J6L0P2_PEROL|nr:hypothetical protein FOZ61_009274 [Perkinsus olseni]KAF4655066.1 hypothetical protein FOL46_008404 [Perkinsus olseni]